MNNDTVANLLKECGFNEAKQEDVLSYHVPYCIYLYRKFNNQHQYVWLVSYNSVFVEAVVEIFIVPRNSKAKYHKEIIEQEKRGYRPIYCALLRDTESLLSQLDKVYPATVKP